jgi:MFS family permease
LFSVSAIGSALAQDAYSFSAFRFIGGLGIGISSVAAPTYISEISTPASRGKLVAMYQFNIVFGILIAFLSNYFLQGIGGNNDWRWMLGVMAVPSLIYTLLVFGIPESPRWLITRKGDIANAKLVMSRLGLEGVESLIKGPGTTVDGSQLTVNGKPSTVNSQQSGWHSWLLFTINSVESISSCIMLLKFWREPDSQQKNRCSIPLQLVERTFCLRLWDCTSLIDWGGRPCY